MSDNRCATTEWRDDMNLYFSKDDDVPSPCLLRAGHKAAHLIQKPDGDYVSWEDDCECMCQNCESDNPELWCVTLWDVSEEEAEKILAQERSVN